MPITGFDFPGVTLRQQYAENLTNTLSTLAVVCVGKQYDIHNRDNTAPLIANFDGNEVSAKPVPGWVSGDIEGDKLSVKDGVFVYADSTTSTTLEPTAVDAANHSITFGERIADGDGLTANALFGTRGVRVGDPLVLKNASFSIVTPVLAVVSSNGVGYDTVVISGDAFTKLLPTPAAADLTAVEFAVYADAEWAASSGAYTESNGSVTVTPGNLVTQLTEFTSSDPNGFPGTLKFGDLYFDYRQVSRANVGQRGVVSSREDIVDQLGPIVPENPLAIACYCAFVAGANTPVFYTGVAADTADAYAEALDFLDKFYDCYSVVPCTTDKDVIKTCASLVEATATNPESRVRRALWYGIETAHKIEVTSEGALVTTISNAEAYVSLFTGTVTVSGTTVTFGDDAGYAPVVRKNVKKGDVLYKDATHYAVVTAAASNSSVTVATNSTLASNDEVVVLRAEPTNNEIIQDLIAKRKARTNSERCQCVWGDGAIALGYDLPAYALAACPAGMRAVEPCQRPISNLGYSFLTMAESHGFTNSQLKQLGADGVWIIASNEDGLAINKKQVTTAVSNNLNKDEESIIANIDTIAINLINVGRNLVGCSNITPLMIETLAIDVSNLMRSYMINKTGSIYIGPQLLSWKLVSIYQDPVNRDHIWANIECEPPKPFNRFNMTLLVI